MPSYARLCVISAFSHKILWNDICSRFHSPHCVCALNLRSYIFNITKCVLKKIIFTLAPRFRLCTRIVWMRILTTPTFLALLFKKENEKENSQHYTRHMHVKSHREQRLKEKEHVLFVLISDYLPGEEERLIQAVEDVDDDVVVGYRVYIRPRELPIDQDTLYPNTRTINPILSSVPNHSKINSMYFWTVLGSNFQNNFPNVNCF